MNKNIFKRNIFINSSDKSSYIVIFKKINHEFLFYIVIYIMEGLIYRIDDVFLESM